MNNRRLATLALLTITAFSTTGCRFFGKAPKASVPVAPAPQVTPAPSPASQPTDAPKPTDPTVIPQPQVTPAEQPAPVKPIAPPVTTTLPPTRPKPKPTPATAAPVPPAAPAPVFGEILTPQQQAQVLQAYEQSAQSARRALSQLNGRALTADQMATANRVRSFLKQADEAKTSDPSSAARLAQRAEVLANNLVGSLQ